VRCAIGTRYRRRSITNGETSSSTTAEKCLRCLLRTRGGAVEAGDKEVKDNHWRFDDGVKKKRLRVKRAKSQKVMKRNAGIVSQIKEIKSEHPLWGFRRVWAYIRF